MAVMKPDSHTVSDRYRYYVLGLLVAVGVCSWVDRNIFSILLEPIKSEFGFSDTQIGLLGGVAFGLFYATVGLPVAWFADRYNRSKILATSVAVWSVMTALCGLATGFATLFLARMGVGIGEAGSSPPSQALVSDYFPPEKRSFALGILFLYVPLGFLVGFLLGGWINQFFGWRTALMVVGLPGLLLALIVYFTLKEPVRGFSERTAASSQKPSSLLDTIRYFLSRRSLRHLPLGGAVHGIGAWGAAVWLPAYFMRTHGMTSGEIGTWLALTFGICGSLGTVLGGRIADFLVARNRDSRWYAWFSALTILSTVPFVFLAFLWPTPTVALLFYSVPILLGHMYLGPVLGSIQSLAGIHRRATAAAIYLFLANLVSMGGGPLIIGAISDLTTETYGTDALRYSILTLLVVTSVWAAGHFFRASSTIRADLSRVNDRV